MSTHEAYIEYAKSKLFLAWSLRSWSFRNPSLLVTAQNTIGLHKLQSRALRLKQRIELETKIYMAAGDTPSFLPNFKDGDSLGPGKIMVKEELCLAHDNPNDDWVRSYKEYARHTKYGVLILAESLEELRLWMKTDEFQNELKGIPYGRLFVFIEHQGRDTGGQESKGYIACIDPGNEEYGAITVDNGVGYIIFGNGTYYHGDLKNGVRHGRGIYVWANGDSYDGDWKYDKMHGLGKYSWSKSGTYYEGSWSVGKRSFFQLMANEILFSISFMCLLTFKFIISKGKRMDLERRRIRSEL